MTMLGYKVKPPDQEECKYSDVYKKRVMAMLGSVYGKSLMIVQKDFDTMYSFLSNFECCYNAVVATSISSKTIAEISAFVFDDMCGYQKLILGSCPGIKISKLVGQVKDESSFEEEMVRVWEEFEDCSIGGDSIDAFISKFKRCYTAVVVTSQPSFEEETVCMWEEFEDFSRGGDSIDTLITNFVRCYTAVVATSQLSFEEEMVRPWEGDSMDTFISNFES